MTGARPRWLYAIFALTALVLVVDATYLYGIKFAHAIHSDSAATVLLASRALHAHAPVFGDWYYGNGEVWFMAPHLAALVPVALLGISPEALRMASILGLCLEACALAWAYRRCGATRDNAWFAAALTLIAWSPLHVGFVYFELSYGLFATYCAVLFAIPASILALPDPDPERRRSLRLAGLGALLIFVVTLQSPTRGLVFTAAPVLAACAWPWRDVFLRRRLVAAAGVGTSYAAGLVTYQLLIKRIVTFSIPSGQNHFELRDLAGMKENVERLGQGLALLAGESGQVSALMIPPLIFMVGAALLVARHALRSRQLDALRFACVAVLAQLSATVLPMLVGNLMINGWSARYMVTSLLVTLGLAAIVAVKELKASPIDRRIALAWLGLVPIVLVLSLGRVVGNYRLKNESGQRGNGDAHADLARELVQRGLGHGFSTYWHANLVTLLSHGQTMTCGVSFSDGLVPFKWNARTTCFERKALPARFYLAVAPTEREAAARAMAKLPLPVDRFTAGGFFEVSVFETAKASWEWLDLPVPDGENLRLPFHMKAASPQIHRIKGVAQGDRVLSTGEEGCVVFGPYMEIPKGRYGVRWIGSVSEPTGTVNFDVLIKSPLTGEREVLMDRSAPASALARVAGGDLVRFELDLIRSVKDLEARVFSHEGAKVVLEELVIERR